MKTACFSTHEFEKSYLKTWVEKFSLDVTFLDIRLSHETVELVKNYDAISCWASDDLSASVLERLKEYGIRFISLRSAGFSHLDVQAAKKLGIRVARVPAYSPQSIAEHTLGLLMCLNRKYLKAFHRVKDFNFTLDGLEGITLHGKNVGIIGVGKIGGAFARIMHGMGCSLYLSDPNESPELAKELNAKYVSLKELLRESDVVSLHCPLNENTRHILDSRTLGYLKKDSFLLNTGRGALIDTDALIAKLKKREIRGVGLDVYEYEENIFFVDHSEAGISDEKLLRLMSFPNVLITSHQAFFTREALDQIARVSCENINQFVRGDAIETENQVVG